VGFLFFFILNAKLCHFPNWFGHNGIEFGHGINA